MRSLIMAARASDYPAEISVVISNRGDAPGLAVASEMGIATRTVEHRRFGSDRVEHERAIQRELESFDVSVVCLAGYMRLLTPFLVGTWRGRMLNIHPSLLPAFPGLDTHARALKAGVRLHGCTVHYVTDEMDDGPILAQAAVPVLASDTEEALASRVLQAEHLIYPAALCLAVGGTLQSPHGGARLTNPLPLEPAVPYDNFNDLPRAGI